ncbi:AaceriAFL009Cp [[Ashbya] aceris (nom. inval.)]|nr:AaceriAFL009Cp [[Ashbya] aceris (nom. inval.)]
MHITTFEIQQDFGECIDDVSKGYSDQEEIYINIIPSADTTIEKRVAIVKRGSNVEFDAGDGNSFRRVNSELYEAIFGHEKVSCRFKLPRMNYSDKIRASLTSGSRSLTAFATTHHPEVQYAIGDADGQLTLHGAEFSDCRTLEGHSGYITSLHYFPSGQVLLSASIDMQLKIWSAVDGTNPRTFFGHTGPITGCGLIERGRNILSSSKDGSVRLWECGSGSMLREFHRRGRHSDSVNALQVLNVQEHSHTGLGNPLEFGTEDKAFIAGHASGVLTYHDVFTKQQLAELPNEFQAACTTLATTTSYFDESYPFYIYAGYENGCVAQWDLRYTTKSVGHITIGEGNPVNSLIHHDGTIYLSSGLDCDCELALDEGNSATATFLVSADSAISQYVSDPATDSVWAVGARSFCSKYS